MNQLTFLGHSSILFEMDGVRILTDPVFRQRIFHLHRSNPAPDPAEFSDVDAILISHLHYDHLDIPTLQAIGNSPVIYIPHGAAPLMERHGLLHFKEIHVGASFKIGGITIQAVPAMHRCDRLPLGLRADCLGFLIRGSFSAYYPGDTTIFPGMAELADELDVALLPVWGWGPHRGKMHMGPEEAADALKLLKPRVAIPIHWGTYLPLLLHLFRPGFHYFPPLEFALLARQQTPDVEVRILTPGEAFSPPARTSTSA